MDDPGLHAGQNFRLTTHLENLYIAVGLKAVSPKISAQTDISGSPVARNSQSFPFEIFLLFDRRLNLKIERRNVDHASDHHDIAAGKIDVDDIAAGEGE